MIRGSISPFYFQLKGNLKDRTDGMVVNTFKETEKTKEVW